MEIVEARISEAADRLFALKKKRALERAQNQNEIQRLRAEQQRVRECVLDYVSGLVKRKKQPANEMSVYRDAITEAFGHNYIPAFCLAKQAFLLRAMHSMISCEEALKKLKNECVANIKDYEATTRKLQEETASTSVRYMNMLIELQHEIHVYETDMESRWARIERWEDQLNRSKSYDDDDDDNLLDDVPLEEDVVCTADRDGVFSVPKRSISSDRTLDTVSISYHDGSSLGDDETFHLDFASSNAPLPRFVNHA